MPDSVWHFLMYPVCGVRRVLHFVCTLPTAALIKALLRLPPAAQSFYSHSAIIRLIVRRVFKSPSGLFYFAHLERRLLWVLHPVRAGPLRRLCNQSLALTIMTAEMTACTPSAEAAISIGPTGRIDSATTRSAPTLPADLLFSPRKYQAKGVMP